MKSIYAILLFMVPSVSFAFSQTFGNGQTGTVVIPAGVTEVTFTGNGGNAGGAGATTGGARTQYPHFERAEIFGDGTIE